MLILSCDKNFRSQILLNNIFWRNGRLNFSWNNCKFSDYIGLMTTKISESYSWFCVCVWGGVFISTNIYVPYVYSDHKGLKRASNSLEMKLQIVISYEFVLGIVPKYSGEAVSALGGWALSQSSYIWNLSLCQKLTFRQVC